MILETISGSKLYEELPFDYNTKLFELSSMYKHSRFVWTGSRIIGGYDEYSDYDLVVYNPKGVREACILSFESCLFESGSTEHDPMKSFVSYTYNKDMWAAISETNPTLNLIATESLDQLHKWNTATELAKGFQLHRKADRIALFDSVFSNHVEEIPF